MTGAKKELSISELEKLNQLPLDFENTDKFKNINYNEFSDFIVYVDESGDYSLQKPDKQYPIFVLAFCIFQKAYYCRSVVPEIQSLKFNFFGHDLVVLHEREIRLKKPPFTMGKLKEQDFLNSLSLIMKKINFILIGSAVRKNMQYKGDGNAYHLALSSCLEALYEFVEEKKQANRKTFVVVEARGDKEDKELELEFRRVCDGENKFKKTLPFAILIKSKEKNSTGLQIADLVARPIGRYILDCDSGKNNNNRAFEALKDKFFCRGGRKNLGVDFEGYGLKIIDS